MKGFYRYFVNTKFYVLSSCKIAVPLKVIFSFHNVSLSATIRYIKVRARMHFYGSFFLSLARGIFFETLPTQSSRSRLFDDHRRGDKIELQIEKMFFGKYLFGKQQLGNRFLTICYLAKSSNFIKQKNRLIPAVGFFCLIKL